MKQFNLAEAKAKLSRLVDQAAKGKGFVIAKSGIPLAKLVPLDDGAPKPFVFGTMRGEFEVPDDFDAPDPRIEALFDGEGEAER
jgi:prevent-host-death family protein